MNGFHMGKIPFAMHWSMKYLQGSDISIISHLNILFPTLIWKKAMQMIRINNMVLIIFFKSLVDVVKVKNIYLCQPRTRSVMDSTRDFGSLSLGSSPSGCTLDNIVFKADRNVGLLLLKSVS